MGVEQQAKQEAALKAAELQKQQQAQLVASGGIPHAPTGQPTTIPQYMEVQPPGRCILFFLPFNFVSSLAFILMHIILFLFLLIQFNFVCFFIIGSGFGILMHFH